MGVDGLVALSLVRQSKETEKEDKQEKGHRSEGKNGSERLGWLKKSGKEVSV